MFFPLTKKQMSMKRQIVNLDRYGNAIPEVENMDEKLFSSAFKVTERCEITIVPQDLPMQTNVQKGLLQKLFGGNESKTSVPDTISIDATLEREDVNDRVEEAFKRLHETFNEREARLEAQIQTLKAQQTQALLPQTATQLKQKKSSWTLLMIGLAGGVALSYMLYVLTMMQTSMTTMSSDMSNMNQHMQGISQDTKAMSDNTASMSGQMQSMNQSMQHLNGQVGHMNQQMGTLSRAAEPMADTAGAMRPFTKMFNAFMPF